MNPRVRADESFSLDLSAEGGLTRGHYHHIGRPLQVEDFLQPQERVSARDPLVEFRETRFNISLTAQEKTDLIAFLRAPVVSTVRRPA